VEARDLAISVNVAANQATEVLKIAYQGVEADPGDDPEAVMAQLIGEWDTAFQALNGQIIAAQLEANKIATVNQAFPGTSASFTPPAEAALPAAPSNVVPFTGAAAQVAQAPTFAQAAPAAPAAPAFGAGAPPAGNDAAWTQFFTDAQQGPQYWATQWHDNRQSKQKATQPDFRSKHIPQPDNPQYKVGLWITPSAKNPNPAWVADQLRAFGFTS
jgi:hypothetical protein